MKRIRSNLLFFSLFFCAIFYPFESLILSYFNIEFELIRWFFALSVILIIFSYLIFPDNHKGYQGIKMYYYLFIFWSIFTLLNSVPDILSDPFELKLFFSNCLLIFSFSFLLICDFNILYVGKMIHLFSKVPLFIIFVFFLCPFLFSSGVKMEFLSYAFVTPIGMLVMLSPYEKNTRKTFIRLAILLFFLAFCVFYGRRAVTLYIIFFILGTIALNTNIISRDSNLHYQRKKNLLPIVIILVIILVLLIVFSQNVNYIIERFNTGFESRESPITEFMNDFKLQDWLIGRGLVGEIAGGLLATTDQGTRYGIESGWLTIILHGGIPYALLHLILCIESIINAFKANNLLCHFFGLFIFYMIIDMIGFGVQFVNIKTLLFYVAISCCHSSYLLQLNNGDIKKNLYA